MENFLFVMKNHMQSTEKKYFWTKIVESTNRIFITFLLGFLYHVLHVGYKSYTKKHKIYFWRILVEHSQISRPMTYIIRYNSPCSRRVSVGELYELDLLFNRNIFKFIFLSNFPFHWPEVREAGVLIRPQFCVISPTWPRARIEIYTGYIYTTHATKSGYISIEQKSIYICI